MSVVEPSSPRANGPAWEIARLFPEQGSWGESDYLSLTDDVRHLVELVDGVVEVLPMPTLAHQRIVKYVARLLEAFVLARNLGEVLFSPVRVHVGRNQFREPDVVFIRTQNMNPLNDRYCERVDLVLEVVSADPKDRQRDLEEKRSAYALAGFPEYWIVDPESAQITVLRLEREQYVVHAEASNGGRAGSALLAGFEVEVDAVFAAAACPR